MPTLHEAVERVNRGLGWRPALDKVSSITQCFQEAQRELEMGKSLPRFLIFHDFTLPFLTGINYLPLPPGFIREDETEPMRYLPPASAAPVKIVRNQYWDALSSWLTAAAGPPKVYVIQRKSQSDAVGRVYIFPVPDANYTLNWAYYKNADVLTANTTNAWLTHAPEWLIGEAGYRYAADIEHEAGMKKFDAMRTMAKASVFGEIVVEDETGQTNMGSNL